MIGLINALAAVIAQKKYVEHIRESHEKAARRRKIYGPTSIMAVRSYRDVLESVMLPNMPVCGPLAMTLFGVPLERWEAALMFGDDVCMNDDGDLIPIVSRRSEIPSVRRKAAE